MRTTWSAIMAAAMFAGAVASARAADQTTAAEVVERAIKAQGGDEALVRSRTLSRTGAGTMSLSGATLPFTEETTMALPDRIRITVDIEKGARVTLIVNGDKGWQASGGAVLELGKERLDEVREESNVLWLATLTPLLKEPYTLTPLPDGSVDGSPTSGVKASAKGHTDVSLYFDKRTNLLVKIQRRARESGVTLNKTYLFSDYKDVDGVKLPVREVQLLEGKKFIERTSANYKLLSRVDDTTFAKP
jgi:hypothetical protein